MNSLKLPRSPQWDALRVRWLKDHPTCAACGSRASLQVHHKIPVHVSRSMELDPANLITLCEKPGPGGKDCHYHVGHLGNWFAYNRNVEQQARDLLLKTYPSLLHPGKEPLCPVPEPIKPVAADPAAAPAPAVETSPTACVRPPSRRR